MKKDQSVTNKADYNFKEVTKALGLSYEELKQSGQIDKILRTGMSDALAVTIQGREINGQRLILETDARLSLGIDRLGRRAVLPILKKSELKLDTYKNISLSKEQQQQLREGKTVLLRDPQNDREILTKVDEKLNRLAGWKKSAFIVPQRLGNAEIGYTELETKDKVALKRGEPITLRIGEQTYRAQVDPADRELKLSKPPKESLQLKPPATVRKIS
jgi:hypothetical protein